MCRAGDDAQLSDIGRIFVVSSREVNEGDIDTINGVTCGAGGMEDGMVLAESESEPSSKDSVAEELKLARLRENRATSFERSDELSICDMDDPHNGNNCQHLFEFVECLLRVSWKHQGGGQKKSKSKKKKKKDAKQLNLA